MRLPIFLIAFVAGLSACGDVERCERGTRGCFAGPPEEGECKLGLVMSNGTCAEPGQVAPPLSCRCEDGTVCSLDGYRCVDYCQPLDMEPGSVATPPTFSCDAAELSFEALCHDRCQLQCRQQEALCADQVACAPTHCESEPVLRACQSECGTAEDPKRCMAQLCSETRGLGCSEISCPNQQPPLCDGVQCRNACPGYNFDGVCDDGEPKSAASGVCTYGTDCADCGLRRGDAPRPQPQGGPCAFHSGCTGADLADIAGASAWCIEIAPGVSRCAPDCTSEGETCPEGSSCFVLSGVDQDGDGEPDPIKQKDLVASACFPAACE
jgi:hypothetical protein